MAASAYYFLSAALAIGAFFLVWAVLNEAKEDSPWITAGLISSGVLIVAGLTREIVLRGVWNRRLIEQRRLDQNLRSVPAFRANTNPDKLTLERNGAFLSEIQRRSDAAKVLSSISASHREVFELCDEYIEIVDKELPNVAVGSPRLRPLSKGREYAARFHRYHMLKWAEGEARSLAQNGASEADTTRKLDRASEVLAALEFTASRYPEETKLEDSIVAVRALVASLRARTLIDKARNERLLLVRDDFDSLLDEAEQSMAQADGPEFGSNPVFRALMDEIDDLRANESDSSQIGSISQK